ncbi:MAG TPA: peptidoglycan-associated lipoprotein Pal [Rhodocyclaceae bacterium]|nr:MAG: peptidoglycan-associated lipoprotein [Betaproteobacteria bacterium CG2_30_68_42]PIV72530.1 MAG: peptidoglycan-associated lipoprotein [Rhodocyclales bacterium CG17_big_fil_post_rev_8_21_14_2_50_68_7]PIX74352.1 MAG: peptidoglycan-associated lipoprotein [Rhodocyclales bacterium CG_4_10_14_3_um_filter_68_10]PJA58334.1 MAG: peptidoglycan-associated lipoprotein [Rhodocyclales bacterium CG_4_9_14_3_um_filter_68_10]HCX33268.1 peptidoglycan-associated lipoprotein Pal [Rhodocyclaceae bacterium]
MPKLLIVAFVLALAGCKSTPTGPEQAGAGVEERSPGAAPAAQPVEPSAVAKVTPAAPSGDAGIAALKDPKNILSKRSVFFEFDSFAIKDEFKPLIEAHAKFLLSHSTIRMLIQGNADERGSREYNLALGQKRADAVKSVLMLLGVKESQIESVSLGEEKPRNPGHDDSAWAENRRVDLLYSGEF